MFIKSATEYKRLIIIRKLVPKILTAYSVDTDLTRPWVENFLDQWVLRSKHRGLEETVKHYKCVRLTFTRWLCGQPLDQYESVALDSDGFPKELLEFKDHLLGSTGKERSNLLRVVLTLLNIGRAFKFKPKLDVSTIIEPWQGKLPDISDSEHNQVLRRLKVKRADCYWSEFHMSTKKGPNGPAMATSLSDLAYLPQITIDDIISIGGRQLEIAIRKCSLRSPLRGLSMLEIWKSIFQKQPGWPRKLSYFSDKEGKTRVIAILDYWSQTALRPLHNHLMAVLRKLKSDCTFSQEAFYSKLPSCGPYYCFDLSAATDRMPILLQEKLLSEILGQERTLAWSRLLTQIGYVNMDYPGFIHYKAGQPMGAYSSWAMMALTHHYIVQLASIRAGVNRYFWDYCLLGDDLVIAHPGVAAQYKILCSILDMPISDAKTHVSLDTLEFAKRWYHRGEEVTGYSIGGLLEVWKRYSTLFEFIENQQSHGWSLAPQGRPGLISHIYNSFDRSWERPAKLFMLYHYIRQYDKSLKKYQADLWVPEREALAGTLLAKLSEFGIPPILTEFCLFSTRASEVVTGLIQELKLGIVKLDMDRLFATFKSGNDKIGQKLNLQFKTIYPDLDDRAYRALLRECSPAIQVMNKSLNQTVNYVQRIMHNDPTLNIFEMGIARFFIAEGIFSLRTAHSISLAESQMTKWFLYVCRRRIEKGNSLLSYCGLATQDMEKSSLWYYPPTMKKREAFFRKRRAERKVSARGTKVRVDK